MIGDARMHRRRHSVRAEVFLDGVDGAFKAVRGELAAVRDPMVKSRMNAYELRLSRRLPTRHDLTSFVSRLSVSRT